jgi:hypothetical protein
MAPRGKKRKSDDSVAHDDHNAMDAVDQINTTTGGDSAESPRKKRKIGITLAQKQVLIDNLQLESMSIKCPVCMDHDEH